MTGSSSALLSICGGVCFTFYSKMREVPSNAWVLQLSASHELLPFNIYFEIVATVARGPLLFRSCTNKFFIIMTLGCFKLTHAMPESKITTSRAALTLVHSNIKCYGILNFALTDKRLMFCEQILQRSLRLLSVKEMMISAYHLQTTCQIE